jgi:spore coat protein U-like protein
MNRKRFVVVAAVVALLAGAAAFMPAQAATATANLAVSASVTANCVITAGTLPFGAYDPVVANAAADLNGAGTFTVACTKNAASVWIGMNTGANASGAQRRMKDAGTDYLNYELYSDAGRTTVWGNTQATGLAYSSTGKAPATINVYGRVPQNQDVAVGAYTDTVVMTVNF